MAERQTGALAVALALALALPATATASTDAVAQAEAAWPNSPCAGTLTVIHDPLLPADRDGELRRPCTAAIRPGLPRDRECDAIVHEAGHAAGFDGGADQWGHAAQGIMAPNGGDGWPGCHPPLTTVDLRAAVRDEVRSMLASPRAAWSIVCGPGVRFVCRATRGPAARRYHYTLRAGRFDFVQLANYEQKRRAR